jgi:hypothetical protein
MAGAIFGLVKMGSFVVVVLGEGRTGFGFFWLY